MEVQLINIGRKKVNKTINVKTISGIYKELKQHLMSKDLEIVPDESQENKYTVYAGMNNVGELIVKD